MKYLFIFDFFDFKYYTWVKKVKINLINENVDIIRTNYLLTLTNSIISAKEDVVNMTYLIDKNLLDIILSYMIEAIQ